MGIREGDEGSMFQIAFGLGLVLLGVAQVWKFRVAHELSIKGVLAKGEIEDFRIFTDYEGPDIYYVSYSFGQGFSGNERVEKEVYSKLRRKDSVTIRHLIRDSKIFRMEQE